MKKKIKRDNTLYEKMYDDGLFRFHIYVLKILQWIIIKKKYLYNLNIHKKLIGLKL
jgi:hypothetical protein